MPPDRRGSRSSHRQGSLMENAFNLPRGLPPYVTQGQTDSQEIATLLEIGQTLADVPHLRRAMGAALELLAQARGCSRAFVLLLDTETEELRAEACYGLNEEAARRAAYRLGEGVVGRVAESGRPVVVPQTSREPALLRRLSGRPDASRETTFVCVPVQIARNAVGVLACEMPYAAEGRDYERLTKLLSVVASMVAQALRVE